MVCTRIGDFTQDVPEPSNAHSGVATNELRNATRGTPPPPLPPLPPVSLEQLLATQNELMRLLTENLVQREVPASLTSIQSNLIEHVWNKFH
jgi:hypothetical protein